jgi:hypothetical protein
VYWRSTLTLRQLGSVCGAATQARARAIRAEQDGSVAVRLDEIASSVAQLKGAVDALAKAVRSADRSVYACSRCNAAVALFAHKMGSGTAVGNKRGYCLRCSGTAVL